MTVTSTPLSAPTPARRTHHFAITISGGIALGSYEAGALSQFYGDIYRFNRSAMGKSAELFIDAIGGASAGSVTGLILAQAIGLGLPPDELEGRMRECWIDLLAIQNLLQVASGAEKAADTKSLFSDSVFDQVIEKALDIRAGEPGAASGTVALNLTVTNLDGIPTFVKFGRAGHAQPSTAMYSLDYKDVIPFVIRGNRIESRGNRMALEEPASQKSIWLSATEAAKASGAFPVAFPGRPQQRNLESYPEYVRFRDALASSELASASGESLLKPEAEHPLPTSAEFQFIDGGILNNEPLGRCIDAVSWLEDQDPRLDPEVDENRTGRSFIIVEPDPQLPEAIEAALLLEQRPRPDASLPTTVLGKILSVYFNSAVFGDFKTAADTNRVIHKLNKSLEALDSLGLPPETVDTLKKNIREAALGRKREITLQRIPHDLSSGNRLACAFAGHFGGFLRKDYRQADFMTGQFEARGWMNEWLRQWVRDHALESGFPREAVTDEQLKTWLGAPPSDPRTTPIPPTNLTPTELAHSGWFARHPDDSAPVKANDWKAALTKQQREEIVKLGETRAEAVLESLFGRPHLEVHAVAAVLEFFFNGKLTKDPSG